MSIQTGNVVLLERREKLFLTMEQEIALSVLSSITGLSSGIKPVYSPIMKNLL